MAQMLISDAGTTCERPVERRRYRLIMRASTTPLPRHGNPTAVVSSTAFAESAPEKSSNTTCRTECSRLVDVGVSTTVLPRDSRH